MECLRKLVFRALIDFYVAHKNVWFTDLWISYIFNRNCHRLCTYGSPGRKALHKCTTLDRASTPVFNIFNIFNIRHTRLHNFHHLHRLYICLCLFAPIASAITNLSSKEISLNKWDRIWVSEKRKLSIKQKLNWKNYFSWNMNFE